MFLGDPFVDLFRCKTIKKPPFDQSNPLFFLYVRG